jgi:hypothetical protein
MLLPRGLPWLLALLFLPVPCPSAGQVVPDSLRTRTDTLGTVPDSLDLPQETPGDSIQAQDTLPALQLPRLARPTPATWGTGVWEWDRDGILASRANTLSELVGQITGAVLLRGGDYGMPVSVSAFGAGGDRIRVFRDGIEMVPLEGSTPDLTRIGLAGLRSVRVVRSVGELRIELDRILGEEGRPLSLVEAGTGDLGTNLFRGTFAHPRAFGGSLSLALDRVDTKGPFGREPGSGSGGWIRYGRGIGSRGSILMDYSRMSSDRGDLFAPESVSRTDWSLRSRWRLLPGLVGDLFYASSSLETDSLSDFDFGLESRRRLGAVLSFESTRVRALTRIQRNSGEGLAEKSAFLEVSGELGRFGGVSGELEWENWGEETASRNRVRGWTAPLFGFSLFAERGSGTWGLPYLADRPPPVSDSLAGEDEAPPADTLPQALPGPRFADHEGSRLGVSYTWKGLWVAGAKVSVTSDSLFLLGLPPDRAGEVRPGGTRKGYEVSGRVPLYPPGLALLGSYQWWDQAENVLASPKDSLGQGGDLPGAPLPDEEMPWRYLPRRSYEASLSFHDTFYPTGNLEVWFDLGVKGRDPMVVPFSEAVEAAGGSVTVPTTVPFYQGWFVRLQIRVVTVRAFVMWENFTVRQRNQDFPGRILPPTRSLYGVRWTMWN